MKLSIDIVMKRSYLFNIVAWNYRKKIGFPVCKKENFAGLQAHRKREKSARASPTPHHTLNEERSARFTAQPLSALVSPNTDRPRPVNNIYIFFLLRFKSFRKILLQPPTYVCWRRARSCWCYSKRAINCKPKQNFIIATWFFTCNLYYHN